MATFEWSFIVMNYINLPVILTFMALLLTACGGGGGGGGAPAPSTDAPAAADTFSLSNQLTSTEASESLSFPAMTGYDSNGDEYTASLKITNGTAVAIVGEAPVAVPVVSEAEIVNINTSAKIGTNGTSWYAPGYKLLFTVDDDNFIRCDPDSYQAPPANPAIGDQGDLAVLTCGNGTIAVLTWRLDAGATDDEAKFVIMETRTIGGEFESSEENRYIIDKAGNVKGIEISVKRASGEELSLSGDRQ